MKIIYDAEDIERHRQYGSEGGKKAAANMTEEARRIRAKKAIETRWNARKEQEKEGTK
jgi:hypothetical protein